MVSRRWRDKPLPIWWRLLGGAGLTSIEWVVLAAACVLAIVFASTSMARGTTPTPCPAPDSGEMLIWSYSAQGASVCQYLQGPGHEA